MIDGEKIPLSLLILQLTLILLFHAASLTHELSWLAKSMQ